MPKVAANPGSTWLVAGGWLSVVAALLHIGCIIGGAEWYRFVGAGEPMAQAVERGEWMPHLLTFGIAVILTIWAAYVFSGAGRLRRLPLLRSGLVVISTIYLARSLLFVPFNLWHPQYETGFAVWSSLIVLAYGIAYALGTWRAWPALSPRGAL